MLLKGFANSRCETTTSTEIKAETKVEQPIVPHTTKMPVKRTKKKRSQRPKRALKKKQTPKKKSTPKKRGFKVKSKRAKKTFKRRGAKRIADIFK